MTNNGESQKENNKKVDTISADTENLPVSPSWFHKVNLESYRAYVEQKLPVPVICIATMATIGTYLSESTASLPLKLLPGAFFMSFTSTGLMMSVAGTAYLSGTYLASTYRGQDDWINHAISGGINGTWISTSVGSVRAVPMYVVGGTVFGIGYFYGAPRIYSYCREKWLESRRKMLIPSNEKIIWGTKDLSPEILPKNQPNIRFDAILRKVRSKVDDNTKDDK